MVTRQQFWLRLTLLLVWIGLGFWAGGGMGAFGAFALFGVVYWVGVLINDGYGKLKRDFGNAGPQIQIDQKVLNMNVEPESAIRGMPYDARHRDPTRPQ
jgi:hypothetical protein